MIPFDFEYYRPSSVAEAVRLFQTLYADRKEPVYYNGGTEIITAARLNSIRPGAVIDIKGMPECHALQSASGVLTVGAAATLTAVAESGLFPLLGKCCSGIADRTARNKITIGGNICARIMYRESVLPLLLSDSAVAVAGPGGVRGASIHQIFDRQVRLAPGEFLLQLYIDPRYAALPYYWVKRRADGPIGYPVVTLAALKAAGRIRVALSGACAFPFRSLPMEEAVNETSLPVESRVDRALQHLPAPILDDSEASAEYRKFVLRSALADAVQAMEGGSA